MKFGTSGLRGLVSDMTDEACAAYVAAFLVHLSRDGHAPEALLVGRDLRPSSPRIAAACRAAARRAGVVAIDCGCLPTPALALAAVERRLPAVMVTGSHIPFDRNGLKFYRADGGEIAKADEAGIVAALEAPAPAAAPPAGDRLDDDARARYAARALDFFPAAALTGMRIGVWQHSAVGRDLVVDILSALGAEVVPLGRSDAFVPIDTEAVSAADRAQARAWTEAHHLDAIATTDGDGDRPLLADDAGVWIRGDVLGLLTAEALGADAVATPVSSSTAIERSGLFDRVLRTRIGSPFVIDAIETLAAEGARLPVGFEANGGFLLGGAAAGEQGRRLSPLPTRDAILPMLSALVAAARSGASLSALTARLPARATASDRLRDAPPERTAPLLAALAETPAARAAFSEEAFDAAAVERVDLTDGVRMVLEGDEVAHLRASGNAPELRCYAEARTVDRAEALVARALSVAARRLRIV